MDYMIEVKISLKPGVIDAEGETVAKSLNLLGISVEKVESEKAYVLTVKADSEDAARSVVETACSKLLANPVIHDYSVQVL